jgi:Lrp/AsnC family transcriptional regulator
MREDAAGREAGCFFGRGNEAGRPPEILRRPGLPANVSRISGFFATSRTLHGILFYISCNKSAVLKESSIAMTVAVAPLPEAPRHLDAIDRKILRVLQDDATLSVAEIGERVGLSSTPCWKRIQRMENEGIITGKVALVDQDRIGLGLSVFVSVESDDHSDAWLQKFASAVSAMPEVMEFYRMAGDVDYMLRVVVADMQSYDIFYKRLIGAVALKNVTSRFAMEKIKSVTALPVPAYEAA